LKREVSRAFQRERLESPREEGVEERSPTTNPWSPSLEGFGVGGCDLVEERRGEGRGEGRGARARVKERGERIRVKG
jgi:hypothetical protein